jgi:hypothetical protein
MNEASQIIKRTCGTTDVHRRLIEESAEYRAARSQIRDM